MSSEKTTLEIIAPSVEEAIERGLDQLGLPHDAVDVEILDSGKSGLFGLGGRQARIRMSIKGDDEPATKIDTPKTTTPRQPRRKGVEIETQEDDPVLKLSAQVVRDLLERMHVSALVTASYFQNGDEDEKVALVDIQGDDLSILIGKRTETLSALQYITGLIVSKELGHWAPIIIDVQGYRTRRERQLRQLAHRMAEQALHTGRRQVLEPMPASERRIIHMELRDNPDVVTESIGEEPNRKVTIALKK